MVKVSKKTEPKKLAGSISKRFEEEKESEVVVSAIGAGAVNQALKAIIIFKKHNTDINIDIRFADVEVDEHAITSIEFALSK